MIVANFYHLKKTNGMYYYGSEYLQRNIDVVRKILVRKGIEAQAREDFAETNVIGCSLFRYLLEICLLGLRGDFVFTPTTHPVPFFRNQWIAFHDAYPFVSGKMGIFKHCLLKLSILSSTCKVGFINHSEAAIFVKHLGVAPNRMIFAPNRFPDRLDLNAGKYATEEGKIYVGLVGTDSSKKKYDQLFEMVKKLGLEDSLVFRVFGHETEYFSKILSKFPDLSIELIQSDMNQLDFFFNRIQVVASASEGEGFGRPIASALLSGVPVKLLDRPVFREFFSEGAEFFGNLEELVLALTLNRIKYSRHFKAPKNVKEGFDSAVQKIREMALS